MAQFMWKVATKGYHWVDEVHAPLGPGLSVNHRGRILTPVEWRFRSYRPLRDFSGLFRTFAATQPAEADIRGFANEYGHLGESGMHRWGPAKGYEFDSPAAREEFERSAQFATVPQPFESWVEAIH